MAQNAIANAANIFLQGGQMAQQNAANLSSGFANALAIYERARQQREANLSAERQKQAEIQAASVPFSGTGFDNQVARTYYQGYVNAGMSPLEAQIKAAQVVASSPASTVVDYSGNIIPIPGRSLPDISASTAVGTTTLSAGIFLYHSSFAVSVGIPSHQLAIVI